MKTKAVERTPGVCGGNPCVPGTRIEAAILYRWTILGRSPAEIARMYPHVTKKKIDAALRWIKKHLYCYYSWVKENG